MLRNGQALPGIVRGAGFASPLKVLPKRIGQARSACRAANRVRKAARARVEKVLLELEEELATVPTGEMDIDERGELVGMLHHAGTPSAMRILQLLESH